MSTRSIRKAVVGAALLGATAAGGALAATAVTGGSGSGSTVNEAQSLVTLDDDTTTTPDSTTTDTGTDDTGTDDTGTDDSTKDTPDGPHEANGITEEPLTGEALMKATAAAQAAVPDGTIVRVETDADGAAYEAHMTNADGTEVTVKLNADFTVASIEEGHGPGGRGGHGRHGGRGDDEGRHGGEGEELLTGDTADQVTAAALAAVPGATVDRVETDSDGAAYEAHMTNADGTRVTVTFDEDLSVAEIQEGH